MFFSEKKNSGVFIFFAVVCLLSYLFFADRITFFPSFIHAWTQSDRYALALGFINNGFDFLHPQTFNLLTAGGITAVDFPIHEYIVAWLMKLTGLHEPLVFRVYILLYGIVGLYFLFKLTELTGGNQFHALLVSVFIMTCPVYTYYLDGFLPSIPSFSNAMIGYYFFFRYKSFSVKKDFVLAISFLTLAALARTPFAIFLIAVCCQQFLSYYHAKKINRKEVLVMSGSLLLTLMYFLHNLHLASAYGSQFLLTFLPAKNFSELTDIFFTVLKQWKFDYFTGAHYITLLALFIVILYLVVSRKLTSVTNFVKTHAWIVFGGASIYFVLMATQFPEHDYYFIDSFYPVVALLLVYWVPKIPAATVVSRSLLMAGTAVLIYFFSTGSAKVLDYRYTVHEWDRAEITRHNFSGAEYFLDSIGISKDAKMLVLDAYTTNTPLILMNRSGHTLLWTTKEKIDSFLKKEYDYVVMQNCFLVSDVVHFDPEIIQQLEKVADNGKISLYKKQKNETRSLKDFLGIVEKNILYRCTNDFERDSVCSGTDLLKRSADICFEGNYSLAVDSKDEFTPTFHFLKQEIPFNASTKILVTAMVLKEDPAKDMDVVISLNHGDEKYFYRNFSINQYSGNAAGWQKIMFQFVLPEIKGAEDKLSLYFWNKEKNKFYLDNLDLTVYRQGDF